MKPTAKMLSAVRVGVVSRAEKRKVAPKVRGVGKSAPSPKDDELQVLGRLVASEAVTAAVRAYAADLRQAPVSVPQNVPVGVLALRVVGVERDGSRVPLPGVRVALARDKGGEGKAAGEDKTDDLGVAYLDVGRAAQGIVAILAGNDTVLEKARFETNSDAGLGLVIDVGASDLLIAPFARGKRIQELFDRTAKTLTHEAPGLEKETAATFERLRKAQEQTEKARAILPREPNYLVPPR